MSLTPPFGDILQSLDPFPCHHGKSPNNKPIFGTATIDSLLCEVKIIAKPFPPQDLVDVQAGVTVCQRQEKGPAEGNKSQNNHARDPGWNHARTCKSLASRHVPLRPRNLFLAVLSGRKFIFGRVVIENKFNKSACHQCRGKMSGEIMMKEELTTHDVEWKVVSGPGQEEEPRRFVETRSGPLSMLA